MSTKSTIAYGKDFHLYHECLEYQHVYLELDSTQFEAAYGRVRVPIPVHIWEVIREFPGVRLDLADLSDKAIREKVEREVDERIHRWKEEKKRNPKSIYRWVGCVGFGYADEPRAKQVRAGLKYFLSERKWQREVKAAIEKLRWENSPEGRKHRQKEHNRQAKSHQTARRAAEGRKKGGFK